MLKKKSRLYFGPVGALFEPLCQSVEGLKRVAGRMKALREGTLQTFVSHCLQAVQTGHQTIKNVYD